MQKSTLPVKFSTISTLQHWCEFSQHNCAMKLVIPDLLKHRIKY